jgi:hypothetical protein
MPVIWSRKIQPLPSYAELADLLCELTENNIANLDGKGPFVSCFTFSGGDAPDHWHRAIAVRESLIVNGLAKRQYRKYAKTKVRSMRPDERKRKR